LNSDFYRTFNAFAIFAILFFGSFTFAVPGIIPEAYAAAVFWDGGGDGTSWSDQLNWDSNTLPTTSDDITIGAGASVSLDIDFFVASSLTILEGGTLTIEDATLENIAAMNINGGVMTITSVGTFVNAGVLTVNGASSFITNITNDGSFTNTGFFDLFPGAFISKFINTGTFTSTGTGFIDIDGGQVENTGEFTNAGVIDQGSDAFINRDGGLFTNSGTFNNNNGGINNQNGSILRNTGDIILSNQPGFGASLSNNVNSILVNSGTITINDQGGSLSNSPGNAIIWNGGTIENFETGIDGIENFGLISNCNGAGQIVGPGTVAFNPVSNVECSPVAIDDSTTAVSEIQTTLTVLTNDFNADGQAITIQSVGSTSNGGTAIPNGANDQILYTSAPSFTGFETFTYAISDDGSSAPDTATVTVDVTPALVVANGIWEGGGNGVTWSDRFNWSNDILPTGSDDIIIDGSATVTLDIPFTLSTGTLTVQNGSELIIVTDSLDNNGGTINNSGDITISNPTPAPTITNANGATINNFATGTITLSSTSGATDIQNSATINNSGTITIQNSGVKIPAASASTIKAPSTTMAPSQFKISAPSSTSVPSTTTQMASSTTRTTLPSATQ